jgi:hypothetical protein
MYEEENQENGLVINRDEELKTFSITQANERNKVTIFHYDLIKKISVLHLPLFNQQH